MLALNAIAARPAEKSAAETAKLNEAARGFEQMFMDMIWQEARKTTGEDDDASESIFAKSHGEKVFQSMLDHEFSGLMSQRGGSGLAEQIVDELQGRGGIGSHGSFTVSGSLPGSAAMVASAATGVGLRAAGPQPVGSLPPEAFTLPLAGPISSDFGLRPDPFTGEMRAHQGIDIAAQNGAGIGAAAPGKVAYQGPLGSYGNVVILDHEGGYRSLYAHLSETMVEAGQGVRRGDLIGKVGSSGRSTGPHLHFEVMHQGVKIDPESLWQRDHEAK